MKPKPNPLGPAYAEQFQDESVVREIPRVIERGVRAEVTTAGVKAAQMLRPGP